MALDAILLAVTTTPAVATAVYEFFGRMRRGRKLVALDPGPQTEALKLTPEARDVLDKLVREVETTYDVPLEQLNEQQVIEVTEALTDAVSRRALQRDPNMEEAVRIRLGQLRKPS